MNVASASRSGSARSFVYRGTEYSLSRRPEFAIAGVIPWCMTVGGGWYRISDSDEWAVRDGRRFVRERLGNNPELTPGLTAAARFPLLLSIEQRVVRAWPAFVAREKGAKTYVNPATGDRVLAVKDQPYWMFEIENRPAGACGTMTGQQSIDDVADLATIWLRSTDA